MNRTQTLNLLSEHKKVLTQRFGVARLANPDSDVDILISFDGPASSRRYFGVQFYLEDLLGCPVDLVTEKALRAELRPYVEAEAVNV
jgi:predicted nucleotidyltransferase